MAQLTCSRFLARFFVVFVVSLIPAVTLAPPGMAAAGGLDPSFGIGGKVHTDFAHRFDEGWGIAVQHDGRIVVAGETVHEVGGADDRDFSVVRYLPDGSLDKSFGNDGKVSTDFGKDFELAFDMTLQPDGKIVAAGESGSSTDDSSFDFALARYNADGSLDTTFGKGGKLTTDFAGDDDEANDVAVQADGKIVLVGLTGVSTDRSRYDFALARYNADGSLDTTFGAGGKLTTDFAGGDDEASRIALLPHGKILAAGLATRAGADSDFALARYNADGSLDTTFGTRGKLTTDFAGKDDKADSLAIQKNGEIVATGGAGIVQNTSGAFALARYTKNGVLDPSFGTGGKVTTELTDGQDEAFAVALQRDGKIIAAGVANWVLAEAGDFALARYDTNGSLDASFGSGGTVTTDFAGDFDNVFDIAIQRDGRIVATGDAEFSDATTSRDIGLARYLAK
jgi:uncharacterized delta-60 repeat protein